ncbi:hypothetical protein AMTR_s00102p00089060 [Amborella trichopoda]|uniref:Uncharacterized protein n=1 Tax=Amborella trichopoda TaxID=13333 RepID=W1NY06_AMBTC|nr:hypothetical protein AMTR_s00102p00089060 [Amborella trichopoda]
MGADNLDGCIDVPVKRGDSALHMTCFDGFLPCVQPLHYAVSGGYLEVVQLLVREGASLTAANVRGKVPAVLAQPESEVRRFLDEAAAAVTSASNSH